MARMGPSIGNAHTQGNKDGRRICDEAHDFVRKTVNYFRIRENSVDFMMQNRQIFISKSDR